MKQLPSILGHLLRPAEFYYYYCYYYISSKIQSYKELCLL